MRDVLANFAMRINLLYEYLSSLCNPIFISHCFLVNQRTQSMDTKGLELERFDTPKGHRQSLSLLFFSAVYNTFTNDDELTIIVSSRLIQFTCAFLSICI